MNTETALAPAVLAEVARLGGQFVPAPPGKHFELDGHPVPAAMGQFLFRVRWPGGTYFSAEDSAIWVWAVRFNIIGWLDPAEFTIQDRSERSPVYFGEADGGNYLLLLDLDDPHPTDPQVYKIDHYDPEQTLYSPATLSEFLHSLEPEVAG
jgi:hypothetical protein